jgi:Uma2 family endonuclease
MPISEQTYRAVALEDPEGRWELACGRLRRKPEMTTEHNLIPRLLVLQLNDRIDRARWLVAEGTARLRTSEGSYYVPDLCVIPWDEINRLRATPGTFEVYEGPMPLVVEVWSPSTGDDDVTDKVPEYQRRGDLEIWRIHPYDRTLTAWRRQPDGSYDEAVYHGGRLRPAALPGVEIDLDALFGA